MPPQETYRSEWLVLSPGSMVTSDPMMLLRAMSGPVVALQLGSVLISVAFFTTGVHVNHVY